MNRRSEAARLGELAYRAYGQHRGWTAHNNNPMPPWSELGEDIQAAWIAAAVQVRLAVESEGCCNGCV